MAHGRTRRQNQTGGDRGWIPADARGPTPTHDIRTQTAKARRQSRTDTQPPGVLRYQPQQVVAVTAATPPAVRGKIRAVDDEQSGNLILHDETEDESPYARWLAVPSEEALDLEEWQ